MMAPEPTVTNQAGLDASDEVERDLTEGRRCLDIEARALTRLRDRLDNSF